MKNPIKDLTRYIAIIRLVSKRKFNDPSKKEVALAQIRATLATILDYGVKEYTERQSKSPEEKRANRNLNNIVDDKKIKPYTIANSIVPELGSIFTLVGKENPLEPVRYASSQESDFFGNIPPLFSGKIIDNKAEILDQLTDVLDENGGRKGFTGLMLRRRLRRALRVGYKLLPAHEKKWFPV